MRSIRRRRPGQWPADDQPANGAFDLAKGRQIEVGLKQAFDGGEWTLAAYRIRKTGLLSRDPLVPGSPGAGGRARPLARY